MTTITMTPPNLVPITAPKSRTRTLSHRSTTVIPIVIAPTLAPHGCSITIAHPLFPSTSSTLKHCHLCMNILWSRLSGRGPMLLLFFASCGEEHMAMRRANHKDKHWEFTEGTAWRPQYDACSFLHSRVQKTWTGVRVPPSTPNICHSQDSTLKIVVFAERNPFITWLSWTAAVRDKSSTARNLPYLDLRIFSSNQTRYSSSTHRASLRIAATTRYTPGNVEVSPRVRLLRISKRYPSGSTCHTATIKRQRCPSTLKRGIAGSFVDAVVNWCNLK